jgi:cobalt-zinc-cadmium efflux system membrane fusion protein
MIDCGECRYQAGVVKVDPSVAKSLLKTSSVGKQESVTTLHLTGEVQLDQTQVVDVPPPADGQVVQVNALLGQRVERGQVLAVVHSADFGEAKAAYLDALTKHEIACKERDRQAGINDALQKLVNRLTKGDESATAPAPAKGSPAELVGEWKSKLLGAAARLKLARSVHDREKELADKRVSSKADFEQAAHELQTAEAEVTALGEEVRLNLSLDKLRADNAARQAEAALNAAQQRLHILGLDAATVQSLRQKKDNGDFALLEVRAPRPGTLITLGVSVGRFVKTDQSLCTIADLANLWIWCDVYERDFALLHGRVAKDKTVPATVRVAAFPDATFPGTIDHVGSTVDENTRTIKVRVQVGNPDGKLKPGMFAHVEAPLPTGHQAARVPREAVLSDEGQHFVFQQWKDGLWVRRDVVVGSPQGRDVEILSGLEEGATIAASGGFMLKSDVLRNKMGAG